MAFRKVGMVRGGLTVGGYSVAKYHDKQSGAYKVCLMRNGRSVGRALFDDSAAFSAWFVDTVPADADGHDTIVKLKEVLK